MKKIVTIITIMAIVFLACCPIISRAATIERKANVSLTASSTTVSKGDTVTFKVVLNEVPEGFEGVYGQDYNLTFDDGFFENFRQSDDGSDYSISGNHVHVVKGAGKTTLFTFLLDVKADTTLTSGSVTLTDNTTEGAGSLSDGNVDIYFLEESYTTTVSLATEEPDDPTPSTVAVKGITVTPNSKEMTVGDTLTLQATVTPSNATNKSVTWASSNSSVASVSSSGVVTAKTEGAATITAKTNDGNYTATCVITVKKAEETPAGTDVKVTGVALDKTTGTVKVGGKLQLTATVAPSNATNKNVTWSSSDPSVASVDSSGLVTGIKEGKAQITVKTVDGAKTAVVTIAVSNEDVVIDIEDNKQSSGGSSSNSGSSSQKSGSDSTTAKGTIPQTGETFVVAAGIIALSSVAIISYRKIKANRDIK